MLRAAEHSPLLAERLRGLMPDAPDYASATVDLLLDAARRAGATDIHLQPGAEALDVKFRIDGVLSAVARLPKSAAANVVARLKVLAGLLTYHADRPQEGRLRLPQDECEMRVCTFPTLHGERAVVRIFGRANQYAYLDDLGLPPDVRDQLGRLLGETSGAILVSGPAGSGKTTTVYACLREIARGTENGEAEEKKLPGCQNGPEDDAHKRFLAPFSRSIVSIEDPIEVAVAGVAQSQVNPTVGLELAAGLRFLMRQDPEVIMVGEIRDRPTAEAALGASLTGHLLLSTFHAGSAAETIGRLSDMGIEPYILRSGLLAILNQRLLRRLCSCAEPSEREEDRLGLDVKQVKVPRGCAACGGTGYSGRFLLVEMLTLDRGELARAVLDRSDTATIERLATAGGMVDRWHRACNAVNQYITSPSEVRRVLGFS
jgi:type II secretory ATPase GspE/PulE/Tfp pilus assembly ATPase PilB-like protein